jgi:DNA modification methylase
MNKIEFGDCRDTMRRWASEGIKAQTCVTSPPYYGLRDYGHEGQIGLEETPEEYIKAMVEVFRCVWDVLEDNGTLWLNIGDSYGANKQLLGIPWKLAFALQSNGWVLRQDIIWHKPNPMPESVQDRCTKAHEYIFLLSKSQKYYYDHESISEQSIHYGTDKRSDLGNIRYEGKRTQGESAANGQQSFVTVNETRNKRSVWTVTTKPYEGAHFAVFPSDLIEPCIMAGAPVGGVVLDPFMGSGTTAQVAQHLGRQYLGCELNPEYKSLQDKRLRQFSLELF